MRGLIHLSLSLVEVNQAILAWSFYIITSHKIAYKPTVKISYNLGWRVIGIRINTENNKSLKALQTDMRTSKTLNLPNTGLIAILASKQDRCRIGL